MKRWIDLSHGIRYLALLLVFASRFPGVAVAESGVSDAVEEPLEFRIYPLHRPAAPEWIELLRESVGSGAYILAGDRAELYVRATPADHEVIAELLQAVDRPARNVRIAVSVRDDVSESRRDRRLDFSGGIAFGTAPSARIDLHPRFEHTDTQQRRRVKQTLLVIDGGSASLFVGEEIPYAEWIVRWGRHWGYFEQEIRIQPVGAFLAVEPRILGDGPLIRIRITPEISYRAAGADPRHVRFTRLSTEVIARDGESVDLGGLAEESDFYRRFLVGRNRSGRTSTQIIRLLPTIE